MAAVTSNVARVAAGTGVTSRLQDSNSIGGEVSADNMRFLSARGAYRFKASLKRRILKPAHGRVDFSIRASDEGAANPTPSSKDSVISETPGTVHPSKSSSHPPYVPAPDSPVSETPGTVHSSKSDHHPSFNLTPDVGITPGSTASTPYVRTGSIGATPGTTPPPAGNIHHRPANSPIIGETPDTLSASTGGPSSPLIGQTPSAAPVAATNNAGGALKEWGAQEEAVRGGEVAKETAGKYASGAQGAAAYGANRVKEAAGSAQEGAARAGEELKEKAGEAAGAAQRAGGRVAAAAGDVAAKGEEQLDRAASRAPPGPFKEIAETALAAHSEEKARAGAVMHDFCLGIPYGGLLTVGGLIWGLLVGSLDALRYGFLCGLVITAASVLSLRAWKQQRETVTFTFAQAVVSFLVFFKEAKRFSQSGAVFPTLLTAVVSFGMVAFFAYNLLAGGNKPKKVETRDAPAMS